MFNGEGVKHNFRYGMLQSNLSPMVMAVEKKQMVALIAKLLSHSAT